MRDLEVIGYGFCSESRLAFFWTETQEMVFPEWGILKTRMAHRPKLRRFSAKHTLDTLMGHHDDSLLGHRDDTLMGHHDDTHLWVNPMTKNNPSS